MGKREEVFGLITAADRSMLVVLVMALSFHVCKYDMGGNHRDISILLELIGMGVHCTGAYGPVCTT